jgi:hypothetical protein
MGLVSEKRQAEAVNKQNGMVDITQQDNAVQVLDQMAAIQNTVGHLNVFKRAGVGGVEAWRGND